MFVQTTPMIFKERNMIHKRSNTFRVPSILVQRYDI